jgi:uncharacterized protein YndB with AHSA1/START domain
MSKIIRKELTLPQPREEVWDAIASSDALAGWMYPNDFEPRHFNSLSLSHDENK